MAGTHGNTALMDENGTGLASPESRAEKVARNRGNIKQTVIALSEIACMSELVQQLLIDVVAADAGEHNNMTVAQLAEAARRIAAQIGWAADMGAAKLNATGVPPERGGAEEWLMPPSYQAAGEVRS